jgi:Arc/MetJ-type ribon-helix-helix transcriptional regulator
MKGLNKKQPTKSINVRVDSDLYEEIVAVRKKAEQLGMRFDASEVCRDALRKAVRSAEKEIRAQGEAGWTAKDQELF